jgi:hypothetical protein
MDARQASPSKRAKKVRFDAGAEVCTCTSARCCYLADGPAGRGMSAVKAKDIHNI